MPYPLFEQKGAGKELWMTEVYVPNSDSNSADRWPEALEVAHNMHMLCRGKFPGICLVVYPQVIRTYERRRYYKQRGYMMHITQSLSARDM